MYGSLLLLKTGDEKIRFSIHYSQPLPLRGGPEEDKEEEVSFSLIAPRNIAVVARWRVSCQAVTYGMECILTAHIGGAID
jgi:hypothetical protein